MNGGCYNEESDGKCEMFNKFGYCKIKNVKERVAKMCARTCRVCTMNAPKLRDVIPECAKEGCCWDNRSPISHGCPRKFPDYTDHSIFIWIISDPASH